MIGRGIGYRIVGRVVGGIIISVMLALISLVTDQLPLYFGLPTIILLPALIVAIAVTRSGEKSFPSYGTLLLTLAWAGMVLLVYSEILRRRADINDLDVWFWSGVGSWLLLGILFAVSELRCKRNEGR
jgi:hypothetical protein